MAVISSENLPRQRQDKIRLTANEILVTHLRTGMWYYRNGNT